MSKSPIKALKEIIVFAGKLIYSQTLTVGTGDTFKITFELDGSNLTGRLYDSNDQLLDTISEIDASYSDGVIGPWAFNKGNGIEGTFSEMELSPTAALGGAATVDEGSLYTLTLGEVFDPGDDTIASYTVNWGDGESDTYTPAELVSSDRQVTHTYADDAAMMTISVDLTDEDGTFLGAASRSITVNNVEAITSYASDVLIYSDGNWFYTFTIQACDPGADEIVSWDVDWGDILGGSVETFTKQPDGTWASSGDGTIIISESDHWEITHTYTANESPYIITASAIYDDSTIASMDYDLDLDAIEMQDMVVCATEMPEQLVSVVEMPAPVFIKSSTPTLEGENSGLFLAGNQSVDEGSEYLLAIKLNNFNTHPIDSITINWGEGVPVVVPAPSQYPAGWGSEVTRLDWGEGITEIYDSEMIRWSAAHTYPDDQNSFIQVTVSFCDETDDLIASNARTFMPGDANRDGTVDYDDLYQMFERDVNSALSWADGDFNGDGLVNDFDYTAWATNVGTHSEGRLTVNNVAPTDIYLSRHSVSEDEYGATVGLLSALDPGIYDTHTFTFVSNPGDIFEIDGNILKLKATEQLDFQVTPSVDVEIKAEDVAEPGQFYSKTFTIQVNVVPVVSDFSLTVASDGVLAFAKANYANSFSDTNSDSIQKVKITSLPTNGMLFLNNVAVEFNDEIDHRQLRYLTYIPSSGYQGSDTFDWNGFDGTSYADNDATATITVGSSNVAPSLDATKYPGLAEINEDSDPAGNTVAEIVEDASITDTPGDAIEAIAVVSVDNSNGFWQYKPAGGMNWTSFTASVYEAVLLEPTTLVRFLPNENYSGTATFVFRAWDQSDGRQTGDIANTLVNGGSTPFSTEMDTAQIHVKSISDAPLLDDSETPELSPVDLSTTDLVGNTVSQIIVDNSITDSSGQPITEAIAITHVDNLNGTWQYRLTDADAWADIIVSDDNALLLETTNIIRFVPSASFSGNSTFTFRAWDKSGEEQPGETADTRLIGVAPFSDNTDTAAIAVTNHAPVLGTITGHALSAIELTTTSLDGDSVADILQQGSITEDFGLLAIQGIAITGVDDNNGVWQYQLTNREEWIDISVLGSAALLLESTDLIRFIPNGNFCGTASFSFRAWDQSDGNVSGCVADTRTSGDGITTPLNGGETAFSSAIGTASVQIVNHAPLISVQLGHTMSPVYEDFTDTLGDTVAEILNDSSIAEDFDGTAIEAIAISAVNTHGVWRYKLVDQEEWIDFPAVSPTSALLLGPDDSICFIPEEDYHEEDDFAFDFRAWDQSDGQSSGSTVDASTFGGDTAFSADIGTATITISSVNDAPMYDNSVSMFFVISEDEDIATLANYSVADMIIDGSITEKSGEIEVGQPPEAIAVVSVDDTNGTWQYWLAADELWINMSEAGAISDESALLLDADSRFRFVPHQDFLGLAKFYFRAWDKSDGAAAGTRADAQTTGGMTPFSVDAGVCTVNVGIMVNDAPVLDQACSPLLLSIHKDDFSSLGNTVSSIVPDGSITEAFGETVVEAIAITSVDNSNGTWQYQLEGDSTWTPIITASESVSLLLGPDDSVRFVPDASFIGQAVFEFRAWDQADALAPGTTTDTSGGNNGGITHFSVNRVNATIEVVAENLNNLAPMLDVDASPHLDSIIEGTTEPAGNTIDEIIVDDSIREDMSYWAEPVKAIAITSVDNSNGTWQYLLDGDTTNPWRQITASENAALLLGPDDSVRFLPTPGTNFAGEAKFNFRAWDRSDGAATGTTSDTTGVNNGGHSPFSQAQDEVSITISNIAPVLDIDANPALDDITDLTNQLDGNTVGDIVADTSITQAEYEAIAITSVDNTNGIWQYKLSGGVDWTNVVASEDSALLLSDTDLVRFVPNGNFSGTATFSFRAWDKTDGKVAGGTADTRTSGDDILQPLNGGTTAYSILIDQASVQVTNHAPTFGATGSASLPSINEGEINPTGETVADIIDNGLIEEDLGSSVVEAIAITSVDNDSGGTWQYRLAEGVSQWMNIRDVAVDAALLLGPSDYIRFLPDPLYNGSPTFTFRAWDQSDGGLAGSKADTGATGGTTAFSTATKIATVQVININSAPYRSAGSLPSVAVIPDSARASISFDVDLAYSDGDSTSFTYKITALPDSTTVGNVYYDNDVLVQVNDEPTLAEIKSMKFEPTTGVTSCSGTMEFSVIDNETPSATLEQTIPITVNAAPVLDINASPSLTTIWKDFTNYEELPGNTVAEIVVDGSISDNNPIEAIAITSIDNTDGNWQYKLAGSLHWLDITLYDDQGLLLDQGDSVRFVPSGSTYGSSTFTFRAWDKSDGRQSGDITTIISTGGANPFSTNSDTAEIYFPNNNLPFRSSGSLSKVSFLPGSAISPIGFDVSLAYDDGEGSTTLTYKITELPDTSAVGTVYLSDGSTQVLVDDTAYSLSQITGMKFQPASGVCDCLGTFAFSVTDDGDPAATLSQSFSITVNNAPTLTAATPNLTAIDEDNIDSTGNTVSDIVDGLIVDSVVVNAVAVTGVSGISGTWQFRLNGTAEWIDFGAVSNSGALLLGPTDRVRFVPDENINGTAGFSFRAWDQTDGSLVGSNVDTTNNGVATAFSSAYNIASIAVTPVNDEPVRDAGTLNGLTVLASSQAVSLGLDGLAYGNGGGSDEIGQTLTYEIISVPPLTMGTIILGGSTVEVGANPSIEDIRGMAFLPAADAVSSSAEFIFAVTDSGSPNATLTQSITINVTDASCPKISNQSFSMAENSAAGTEVGTFEPDQDELRAMQYEFAAGNSQGIFAIDSNTGVITVACDNLLDYEAESSHLLVVKASLRGLPSLSSLATATVNLSDVNDAPVITNSFVVVPEDAVVCVPFTAEDFESHFSDQDTGGSLQEIKVTKLPTKGLLLISGTEITEGTTITKANIKNLTYQKDYASTREDTFSWNAYDGECWADSDAVTVITSVFLDNIEKKGLNLPYDEDAVTQVTFAEADFTESLYGMSTEVDYVKISYLQRVKITSLPEYGNLYYTVSGNEVEIQAVGEIIPRDSLSSLKYKDIEPNFNGADTFTWQASDETTGNNFFSSEGTVHLYFEPVNDAPLLADANPLLSPIAIGDDDSLGNTVAEIVVDGSITENPFEEVVEAIAITNVDNLNGEWQFKLSDSNSWSSIDLVSPTGSVSTTHALPLGPNDSIRFVPNNSFTGTSSFTFIAWDQSVSEWYTVVAGTETDTTSINMFSSASDTATIHVKNAPVLEGTTSPSLSVIGVNDISSEGNTIDDIIGESIAITAVDNSKGIWQYRLSSSDDWVSLITASDSQALLLDTNSHLRFLPRPNYTGNASFTFRAWDMLDGQAAGEWVDAQEYGGASSFSEVADMAAIVVNDAPSLVDLSPTMTTVAVDAIDPAGNSIAEIVIDGSVTESHSNSAVEAIAVTDIDDSDGTWWYRLADSDSWTEVGIVSGTEALLLGPTDYIRFVPTTLGFSGTATFNFRAWDRSDGSSPGSKVNASTFGVTTPFSAFLETATVTISPLPASVSQSITINEDDASGQIALLNYIDPGETRTLAGLSIVSDVLHGTLSEIDTGTNSVTYTPDPDYNGTDSFAFTATYYCNVTSGVTITSEPIKVDLEVTPTNDEPVVSSQSVIASPGVPLIIQLGDDGDPEMMQYLSLNITNDPEQGTLSNFSPIAGTITYTLSDNYQGTVDSFSYSLSDYGEDGCLLATGDVATVSIQIVPLPEITSPVSNQVTNEDTPLGITLDANDGDGSLVRTLAGYDIVENVSHGTLGSIDSSGNVTYSPEANFNGSDSFTVTVSYYVTGTAGEVITSDPFEVTIDVTAVNDKPVGSNQTLSAIPGVPLVIALGNDGDPEIEQQLSHSAITVSQGTLSDYDPATGNITFTPALTDYGQVTFSYSLTDDNTAGGASQTSDLKTIEINILPLPIADQQQVSTVEDSPVAITLTGNDGDDNAVHTLIYNIVAEPSYGILQDFDFSTGNLTYSPELDFNGSDSFAFTVSYVDSLGTTITSEPSIVELAVEAINDRPNAITQTIVVAKDTSDDTSYVISLGDDGDPEVAQQLAFNLISIEDNGDPSRLAYDPATGNITYTHPLAASETYYSFTYTLTDNADAGYPVALTSEEATISIVLKSPPTADPQAALTVSEDTALPLTLSGSRGDSGADTTLRYEIVSPPSNGQVVDFNETTGTLTYIPDSDYHGADSFGFVIIEEGGINDDPEIASEMVTVNITVTPQNDAPIAEDQYVCTAIDTPIEITLFGDDGDPEVEQTLTFGISDDPDSGTYSIDPVTGIVTYTPGFTYNPSTSFTYTVTDDHTAGSAALTTTATVIIYFGQRPIAHDSVTVTTTDEDTPVALTLTGEGGDPNKFASLSYMLVTQPAHGSIVSLDSSTGDVVYEPDADYFGDDSFTFAVYDSNAAPGLGLDSEPATVSINVLPVNDAPLAELTQDVTVTEGASTKIWLRDAADTEIADIIEIDWSASLAPAHGILSDFNPETGEIVYTPDSGYSGNDSFTFVLKESGVGGLSSNPGTVNITVVPAGFSNQEPNAHSQSVTTSEATAISITLTGDDGEPVRTPDIEQVLTYTVVCEPAHGTISGFDPATGHVTYTPDDDFYGDDEFSFIVTDDDTVKDTDDNTVDDSNKKSSSPAVVTINVTPVNSAPTAENMELTILEDHAVTICLRGDDGDPGEEQELTYAIVTPAEQIPGTIEVVDAHAGLFLFTPAQDWDGSPLSPTFSYTVTDDGGAAGTPLTSASATVTISVEAVDHYAMAMPQAVTTLAGQPVTIHLQTIGSRDANPDISITYDNPTSGTLSDYDPVNHTIIYTPGTGPEEAANFNFTVYDNSVLDDDGGIPVPVSTDATVAITIKSATALPDANNEQVTMRLSDGSAILDVLANDTYDGVGDLSIDSLTQPTNGTATVVTIDGHDYIRFDPEANYQGTLSFSYTIKDSSNNTATGSIQVTVDPSADLPEDGDITFANIGFDTDLDSTFTRPVSGNVTTSRSSQAVISKQWTDEQDNEHEGDGIQETSVTIAAMEYPNGDWSYSESGSWTYDVYAGDIHLWGGYSYTFSAFQLAGLDFVFFNMDTIDSYSRTSITSSSSETAGSSSTAEASGSDQSNLFVSKITSDTLGGSLIARNWSIGTDSSSQSGDYWYATPGGSVSGTSSGHSSSFDFLVRDYSETVILDGAPMITGSATGLGFGNGGTATHGSGTYQDGSIEGSISEGGSSTNNSNYFLYGMIQDGQWAYSGNGSYTGRGTSHSSYHGSGTPIIETSTSTGSSTISQQITQNGSTQDTNNYSMSTALTNGIWEITGGNSTSEGNSKSFYSYSGSGTYSSNTGTPSAAGDETTSMSGSLTEQGSNKTFQYQTVTSIIGYGGEITGTTGSASASGKTVSSDSFTGEGTFSSPVSGGAVSGWRKENGSSHQTKEYETASLLSNGQWLASGSASGTSKTENHTSYSGSGLYMYSSTPSENSSSWTVGYADKESKEDKTEEVKSVWQMPVGGSWTLTNDSNGHSSSSTHAKNSFSECTVTSESSPNSSTDDTGKTNSDSNKTYVTTKWGGEETDFSSTINTSYDNGDGQWKTVSGGAGDPSASSQGAASGNSNSHSKYTMNGNYTRSKNGATINGKISGSGENHQAVNYNTTSEFSDFDGWTTIGNSSGSSSGSTFSRSDSSTTFNVTTTKGSTTTTTEGSTTEWSEDSSSESNNWEQTLSANGEWTLSSGSGTSSGSHENDSSSSGSGTYERSCGNYVMFGSNTFENTSHDKSEWLAYQTVENGEWKSITNGNPEGSDAYHSASGSSSASSSYSGASNTIGGGILNAKHEESGSESTSSEYSTTSLFSDVDGSWNVVASSGEESASGTSHTAQRTEGAAYSRDIEGGTVSGNMTYYDTKDSSYGFKGYMSFQADGDKDGKWVLYSGQGTVDVGAGSGLIYSGSGTYADITGEIESEGKPTLSYTIAGTIEESGNTSTTYGERSIHRVVNGDWTEICTVPSFQFKEKNSFTDTSTSGTYTRDGITGSFSRKISESNDVDFKMTTPDPVQSAIGAVLDIPISSGTGTVKHSYSQEWSYTNASGSGSGSSLGSDGNTNAYTYGIYTGTLDESGNGKFSASSSGSFDYINSTWTQKSGTKGWSSNADYSASFSGSGSYTNSGLGWTESGSVDLTMNETSASERSEEKTFSDGLWKLTKSTKSGDSHFDQDFDYEGTGTYINGIVHGSYSCSGSTDSSSTFKSEDKLNGGNWTKSGYGDSKLSKEQHLSYEGSETFTNGDYKIVYKESGSKNVDSTTRKDYKRVTKKLDIGSKDTWTARGDHIGSTNGDWNYSWDSTDRISVRDPQWKVLTGIRNEHFHDNGTYDSQAKWETDNTGAWILKDGSAKKTTDIGDSYSYSVDTQSVAAFPTSAYQDIATEQASANYDGTIRYTYFKDLSRFSERSETTYWNVVNNKWSVSNQAGWLNSEKDEGEGYFAKGIGHAEGKQAHDVYWTDYILSDAQFSQDWNVHEIINHREEWLNGTHSSADRNTAYGSGSCSFFEYGTDMRLHHPQWKDENYKSDHSLSVDSGWYWQLTSEGSIVEAGQGYALGGYIKWSIDDDYNRLPPPIEGLEVIDEFTYSGVNKVATTKATGSYEFWSLILPEPDDYNYATYSTPEYGYPDDRGFGYKTYPTHPANTFCNIPTQTIWGSNFSGPVPDADPYTPTQLNPVGTLPPWQGGGLSLGEVISGQWYPVVTSSDSEPILIADMSGLFALKPNEAPTFEDIEAAKIDPPEPPSPYDGLWEFQETIGELVRGIVGNERLAAATDAELLLGTTILASAPFLGPAIVMNPAILVGVATGAGIGAAYNIAGQLDAGASLGNLDWGAVGKSALIGGAVGGLTGGAFAAAAATIPGFCVVATVGGTAMSAYSVYSGYCKIQEGKETYTGYLDVTLGVLGLAGAAKGLYGKMSKAVGGSCFVAGTMVVRHALEPTYIASADTHQTHDDAQQWNSSVLLGAGVLVVGVAGLIMEQRRREQEERKETRRLLFAREPWDDDFDDELFEPLDAQDPDHNLHTADILPEESTAVAASQQAIDELCEALFHNAPVGRVITRRDGRADCPAAPGCDPVYETQTHRASPQSVCRRHKREPESVGRVVTRQHHCDDCCTTPSRDPAYGHLTSAGVAPAIQSTLPEPPQKTNPPQKPSATRRWLRAGLIACLLVGSFLLFRGATPQETASRLDPAASAVMAPVPVGPKFATSTIEQMRVGQWVLARNPELSESEHAMQADIDPATWRKVGLRMEKGDGSRLDVVLLRPLDWLEEYGAEPGATIYLDLPELGAEGRAEVLSVDACPDIPPSPSPDCRVVTGRFTHESAEIIDLQIEGLPAPIGCTSNHPFWSEDRQDFVEAGDLNQGETLRTADERLVHVVSITRRKTPETVYNLEVDTEHVYYVSDAGVLVHNAYPKARPTKYHKRTVLETGKLRKAFNSRIKSRYLKWLAKQKGAKSKYSKSVYDSLVKGKVPDGYNVHHKLPLFRGGNNRYSNLDLIPTKDHTSNLHWYPEGANPYFD